MTDKLIVHQREPFYDLLGAKVRTASLILAAGLGTRLGYKGPKGTLVVAGKSLFEWHCEKIKAMQPNSSIIALLLSEFVAEETLLFFEKNGYFGLEKSQFHFLIQPNQPYLSLDKEPLYEACKLLVAPNGNGGLFDVLFDCELMQADIDYLQIISVDNPLAHPLDPFLTACIHQTQAEIVIEVIDRKESHEKMGRLIQKEGKIQIEEYIYETNEAQSPSYYNVGHYCFKMDFLRGLASHKLELPLHWMEKRLEVQGKEISVLKGEKFLFDILPYASSVELLCSPRELCFAPIKCKEDITAVATILKRATGATTARATRAT